MRLPTWRINKFCVKRNFGLIIRQIKETKAKVVVKTCKQLEIANKASLGAGVNERVSFLIVSQPTERKKLSKRHLERGWKKWSIRDSISKFPRKLRKFLNKAVKSCDSFDLAQFELQNVHVDVENLEFHEMLIHFNHRRS